MVTQYPNLFQYNCIRRLLSGWGKVGSLVD